MTEANDPRDAALRRLIADAVDDAPTPPSTEEMIHVRRHAPVPDERPYSRRRWLTVAALGTAAALVIALITLPDRGGESVPIDTPAPTPATTPPPTDTEIDDTVAGQADPATTPPTIAATTTAATEAPSTTDTADTTTAPEPAPPVEPAVVAAVDANGDAVLLPADGGEPLVMYDGPSSTELDAVEEGPGPDYVEGIALTLDGNNVFVGLCCEPVAGSILSGAPRQLRLESVAFGYAPAISPDGRLLAVGQIQGPAIALTDLTTGFDLEVPAFTEVVGTYTPFDTVWLDATRVVGLGSELTEDGFRLVAVPMLVEDATVTMGESLVLGETLAMGEPIEQVRTAGVINRDYFGIHSPGNSAAVAIEFRLDGVVDTQPAPDVGDPARSIWFEEDGTLTWVAAADGTLRRGDMIIPGEYLWARPTVATTFTTPPDPPVVDVGRGIELDDASLFGLIFGAEVDVDRFVPDVSTQLGEPTLDTGWLPVGDEWSCTGSTDFRTIWWGDVRTTFERSDEPIPRLTAWSVGDPSVAAGAPLGGAPSSVDPSGVVTDRGFGTGATRSEVTSATDDIGIFNDETDRWVVLSNGSATLVQFDDDLVSGIGVSRLDCLEPDPDR